MKKNIKPFSILLTLLTVAFFFVILFPVFKSRAENTMVNVYLYLSRIENDLDGETGNEVEMILVFQTTQAFSTGGKIELFFPLGTADADIGKWCRTADDLDVEGVTETDIPVELSSVTALPGTLEASCTQGTAGTVGDSIEITGLTALTADTYYGVKFENGTVTNDGVLGTSTTTGAKTVAIQVYEGSDIDSRAISVYLIGTDTVTISAQVSTAPTVDCTLNTSGVTIPTLYPGGVLRTVTVSEQIKTSSPTDGGYYWAAYGKGHATTTHAALVHEGNAYFLDSTNTTVDLLPGNSEGFGINIANTTGTVVANFQDTVAGRFGGLSKGPDGARLILYNTADVSDETADVIYGARASDGASTGAYSEEITYVCGGYY